MASNKTQALYDYLKGKKAQGIGESADEFINILGNPDKLQAVYDYSRKAGVRGIGNNANELYGILTGKPQEQPTSTIPSAVQEESMTGAERRQQRREDRQQRREQRNAIADTVAESQAAINPRVGSTAPVTPQEQYNQAAQEQRDRQAKEERRQQNADFLEQSGIDESYRSQLADVSEQNKRFRQNRRELMRESQRRGPNFAELMPGAGEQAKKAPTTGYNATTAAESAREAMNNAEFQNLSEEYQAAKGDYNANMATEEYLRNAVDLIDQIESGKAELANGFWDSATRQSTWDFGVSNLINANTVKQVADKVDAGEELTPAEERMLEAMSLSQMTEEMASESLGNAYHIGKGLPVSLSFMLQMASNPASGMGRRLSETAARSAMKRLGTRESVKKLTYDVARKRIMANAAIARVGGDIAEAGILTSTIGAANVAANTMERMNGNTRYYVDDNGVVQFDKFDKQENVGTAFRKAWFSNFFENWSEAFGEYLPSFQQLKAVKNDGLFEMLNKTRREGIKKGKLDALRRDISGNTDRLSKWITAAKQRTKFDGFFGEVMEEELNIALNSIPGFTEDQSRKDYLDIDNQIQIIGSCAIMSGAIKAAEFGANVNAERTFDKALAEADNKGKALYGDEAWNDMKNQVEAMNPDDAVEFLKGVNKDDSLTPEQRMAINDYTARLLEYQTFNNASKIGLAGKLEKSRQDVIDNYNAGRYLRQASGVRRMYEEYDKARAGVSEELAARIDELVSNGKPITKLEGFEGLSKQEMDAATRLLNVEYSIKGFNDNIQDQADIETDRIARDLDPVTTIKDGREVVTTAVLVNGTKQTPVYVLATDEAGESATIVDSMGQKQMVKINSLQDMVTSSRSYLEDAYRNRYVDEETQKAEWNSRHNERTQQPVKGMQLKARDGQDLVVLDVDDMNGEVTVIEGQYDPKLDAMVPKSTAVTRQIPVSSALLLQDMEYDRLDAEKAKADEANNLSQNQGQNEGSSTGGNEQSVTETPEITGSEQNTVNGAPETPQQENVENTEGAPETAEQQPVETPVSRFAEESDEDMTFTAASIQKDVDKLTKEISKPIDIRDEKAKAKRQKAKDELAKLQAELQEYQVELSNRAEQRNAVEAEKRAAAIAAAEEQRKKDAEEEAARQATLSETDVPDWTRDKAEDARSRGFRIVDGVRVERQQPVQGITGNETEVKFGNDQKIKGRWMVVPASSIQPSHKRGQRNQLFFINEVQPKERTDEASQIRAQQIASNINPQEVVDGVTAFAGAPIINSRGEVIQGNGRSDALQQMYEGHPEQAAKYSDYIKSRMAELGIDENVAAGIENPVLVRMTDVSDEDAIRLGQMTAQDTESGGNQRIDPQRAATGLGDKYMRFASVLLDPGENADNTETESMSETIHRNGDKAIDFLLKTGVINPTQAQSCYDGKGNLKPEAKQDLMDILKRQLFMGGNDNLAVMFDVLPAAAQKSILATIHRDADSPSNAQIKKDIQESVEVLYYAMMDEHVRKSKSYEDVKRSMDEWSRQRTIDPSALEGSFIPKERYSIFALELAVRFKSGTQKSIGQQLNNFYDLVQGVGGDIFNPAENLSKNEAIERTFNIKNNDTRTENSAVEPGAGNVSTAGRPGSSGSIESEQDAGRGTAAVKEQSKRKSKPKSSSEQKPAENTINTQEEPKQVSNVYAESKTIDDVKSQINSHKNVYDSLAREMWEDRTSILKGKGVTEDIMEAHPDLVQVTPIQQIDTLYKVYNTLKSKGFDTSKYDDRFATVIQDIQDYNNASKAAAEEFEKQKKANEDKKGTVEPKQETNTSEYGANNEIVTKDRYEELKRRMRNKLNNLNAGFDPETFAIGCEMAAYHMEAGARSFVDFCKRMITDLGDAVRPYLKSFYNGSRDLPGMEELSKLMDDFNTVSSIDVNAITIDEPEPPTTPTGTDDSTESENDNTPAETKYKAGDKVVYSGKEMAVDSVNKDGSYNLIYDPTGFLPTYSMGIDESELSTPATQEQKDKLQEMWDGLTPDEQKQVVDELKKEQESETKTELNKPAKTKTDINEPGEKSESKPFFFDPNEFNEGDTFISKENGTIAKIIRITKGKNGRIIKVHFVVGSMIDEKIYGGSNDLSLGNLQHVLYVGDYEQKNSKKATVSNTNDNTANEEEKPKTKDGWLLKIGKVYLDFCKKYGVPVDPLFIDPYPFSYKATKGYRLDELERYYESYKKKLDEPVEPATEKQINFLNKLSGSSEMLKGLNLSKVAASYAIKVYKAADDAVYDRMSTYADFVEFDNEIANIAEANGRKIDRTTDKPIEEDTNTEQASQEKETDLVKKTEITEETQTEQQPDYAGTIGTIVKDKHTKTGEDIWYVKPDIRVEPDVFKMLNDAAKKHNGYWSSFAKKNSFLFKTEEDAEAFNNEKIEGYGKIEEQRQASTAAVVSQAGSAAEEADAVAKDGEATKAQLQHEINKIDDNLEAINDKLAVIGTYTADKNSKWDEEYEYLKSAELKARIDMKKLGKSICIDLGLGAEHEFETKSNIAPAGGEVSLRIPLKEDYILYLEMDVMPSEDNSQYNQTMLFWRAEKIEDGGKGRKTYYQLHHEKLGVTYDELINNLKSGLKKYIPEQTDDIIEQIKDIAGKTKEKKQNDLPLNGNNLFGDLFADLNANESQDNKHGLKVGDKARFTLKGRDNMIVTIVDIERDGRPIVDSFGVNWMEEITDWKWLEPINDIEPINNSNNDGLDEGNTGTDAQVGEGEQQTPEEPTGGRMDRNGSDNTVHNGVGSSIASGNDKGNGEVKKPKVKKNTHNNHQGKNEVVVPRTPAARFKANVDAIRTMRRLVDSEKPATKEDMAVLRQFTGWGGLGGYFKDTYSSEYSELKKLLTPEEFDDAVLSVNSAYFTPEYVVDSLWSVAKKLGFKGGNILEGSAGIGNILAVMPKDISESSDITAVEIEPVTGNILKLLYPDANVQIKGFQDVAIESGSVDLAITNVPFVTGLKVIDEIDKDLSNKFANIHDFCIAKNLRKLAEGGLGIFITTKGTLDSGSSKKLRTWITGEGNCDVIGAYRLNKKTFDGASVTSDILVIRKRVGGVKSEQAIDISNVDIVRNAVYKDEKNAKYNHRTGEYIIPEVPLALEYNNYFIQHPENMGGEIAFAFEKGDTYHPTSIGVYPADKIDQAKSLTKWINGFNQESQSVHKQTATSAEKNPNAESVTGKEGQICVNSKGEICKIKGGVAVPIDGKQTKVHGYERSQVVKDYDGIKKALQNVLDIQTKTEDDTALNKLLKEFNTVYDTFVQRYGHMNNNVSLSWLRNDVDYAQTAAIESYKEVDNNGKKEAVYKKTDVFNKRVIGVKAEPKPKNIKDGIILSINKYGNINAPYIAESLGLDIEDTKRQILDTHMAYASPVTGMLEPSYIYLSGNVREKLRYATEMNVNGKYNDNIEALKKIIPADIPTILIEFSIGSDWIEPSLYEEFCKEKYDTEVKFTSAGGRWMTDGVSNWEKKREKNRAAGVHSDLLNMDAPGTTLMLCAMNNTPFQFIRVTKTSLGTETEKDQKATDAAAVRVQEIREEFKEWCRNKMLQDSELSNRMTEAYNYAFNNYVPVTVGSDFVPERFEGQVLTMGNKPFELRKHQKNAVIRSTMEPVLLAHEVGSGKTFTLISSAMEMKRLGTATKPMIVVQNATVGQFVTSAKQLYPNARILTVNDNDRTKDGRIEFYSKIKYNDWDMIIVPQSVFEMMPDSPERKIDFITERIDEKLESLAKAREANIESRQLSSMENELSKLKTEREKIIQDIQNDKKGALALSNASIKARKQMDRRQDEVDDFDKMGIDALLIDEAHAYKRLGFDTTIKRGVKGIDTANSKRSAGVYMKTRSIFDRNGWKNVVFATGTPISNTAAEIWTFMKYLMKPEVMKANHIYYFDDFVRNFGNITQNFEHTTSGKPKEVTRFAAYNNVPELVRIWASVSDTVRTVDAENNGGGTLKDEIPVLETGREIDNFLEPTPSLIGIMNAVKAELQRFEEMTGKEKKENSYIPLVMFGIAKRAAIDARLVEENAEDEPNSKTNNAVRDILSDLKKTESYKGTIAVFCDNFRRLANQNGKKVETFNLFNDIKEKLIKNGVPENQIVIMTANMSTNKKEQIFSAVNAGDVRVIMGTTQTLGTGVNIQERLHMALHIDAPVRPMDYTQRNGRLLRQGNLHKQWGKEVKIVRYGVKDSLDVTAYQRLQTKEKFINSVMNGKHYMSNSMDDRVLEEEEESLFDNPVAQLSGSEFAIELTKVERELRKYRGKKEQHRQDQIYIENALNRNSKRLPMLEEHLKTYKSAIDKFSKTFKDGKPKVIIFNGARYTNNEDLQSAIRQFVTTKGRDYARAIENNAYKYISRSKIETIEIDFDGIPVKVEISGYRMYSSAEGRYKPDISYSFYVPEVEGETSYVHQATSLKNVVEQFINDFASTKILQSRLKKYEDEIGALKKDNELMSQRRGKPFEFEEELNKLTERANEVRELMKAELKAKEEKYASMASVKTNLDDINYDDEEDSVQDSEEHESVISSESDNINKTPEPYLSRDFNTTGMERWKINALDADQISRYERSARILYTTPGSKDVLEGLLKRYGFADNVEVLENKEAMIAKLREVGSDKNADELEGDKLLTIPGFYKDGKMYIMYRPGTMLWDTLHTIIHEGAHGQNTEDKRFLAQVSMMVKSGEATEDELRNAIQSICHTSFYDSKSGKELYDEFLAHAMQSLGQGFTSEHITDNKALQSIINEYETARPVGNSKWREQRSLLNTYSAEASGRLGRNFTEGGQQPVVPGVNQESGETATGEVGGTLLSVVRNSDPFYSYNRPENEEEAVRLSIVKDQKLIDKLESEPKITVYRAMTYDEATKLFGAPMAGKGLKSAGKKRIVLDRPTFGQWEKSDENLETAVWNENEPWAHIIIEDDADGATTVAYNPYIHTSLQMLNDQFKKAWRRPNMVVVRCEIPASEAKLRSVLTNKEGAKPFSFKGAKNTIGWTDEWNTGPVSKRFKNDKRIVILSRYAKPVEIVSMDEYASSVKDLLKKNNALEYGVPFNCVTPDQREALVKAGVKITSPTNDKAGEASMDAYKEWLGNNPTDPTGTDDDIYTMARNAKSKREKAMLSVTPEHDKAYLDAVKSGDMKAARKLVKETAEALGYSQVWRVDNWNDKDKNKYSNTDGVFYAEKKSYFDHSDTGYDSNDAKKFYISPDANLWRPIRELKLVANSWKDIKITDEQKAKYGIPEDDRFPRKGYTSTDALAKAAKQLGYDGVYLENIVNRGWPMSEYAIFNSKFVKSADVVTYDDNGEVIPLSQRFNPENNDIRFSVVLDEDERYMTAVKAGDMDKVQKMVDEAAKTAGYNQKVYRVDSSTFIDGEINPNRFNDTTGVFYTDDLRYFDKTDTGYKKEKAKKYYMNTNNFFDPMKELKLDANSWSDIRGSLKEFDKYGISDEMDFDGAPDEAMTSTDGLAYAGKKLGYNGTILRNIPQSNGNEFTEYAVYNSDIVKSADPVTYDNDGNVIPLSQRFNPGNDDTRFSITPAQDEEFRKAYEAGDETKAMEMLKAAFKEKYPNNKLGAKIFYKGKNGEWKNQVAGYFTDDEEFASHYGFGDTKQFFLNMVNPYEYDFKESGSDGDFEGTDGEFRNTYNITREADKEAKAKGIAPYDGYILSNVGEGAVPGLYVVDDYITNNPKQVKSAEPFTFDDNGELIPLSKRFNDDSDDIRFSVQLSNKTLDKLSDIDDKYTWGTDNYSAYDFIDDFERIYEELEDKNEKEILKPYIDRIEQAREDYRETGGRDFGESYYDIIEDIETLINGDDTRYSIVGQKAAQALDYAIGGRRMTNLFLAKNFERQGKTPKLILSMTGWQKGADGKWKMEEPDGKFTDRFEPEVNETYNLGDIWQDDVLFKAYPELENVKVVIDPVSTSEYGHITGDGKEIHIAVGRPSMLGNQDIQATPEDMRSTMLHEIQHYIQMQEGFARGGNPEMKNPNNANEILGKDGYWKLAGEVESRNEQRRAKIPFAERVKKLFEETADVAKEDQIMLYNSMVANSNNAGVRMSVAPDGIKAEYDKAIQDHRFAEVMQDYAVSLRSIQEVIANNTDKPIADWENVYKAENRLTSVNRYMMDEYQHVFLDPLNETHRKLVKEIADGLVKSGMSKRNARNKAIETVDMYLVAKHGLERNEVFARRDAERDWNTKNIEEQKAIDKLLKEELKNGMLTPEMADELEAKKDAKKLVIDNYYENNRDRDYSGLTSLFGASDVAVAESMAQDYVDDFEKKHNTKELWDRINMATSRQLAISKDGGRISSDTRNNIDSMFKNYVPLRGFKEDVSEDVYDYLTGGSIPFSPAVLTAKGRSSLAESPIATIANMGMSTILQSNRNKVKLTMLRLAENHHTPLISVSQMVYHLNDDGEWEECVPNIPVKATPEQAEAITKAFRAQLAQDILAEPDKYKTAKELANVPYKVVSANQMREHEVVVYRDGAKYILTVNGNPKAAQAVNGQLNPEANRNEIVRTANNINRFLAANFTTRNPAFVLSNLTRDAIYANSIVWVKESPRYAANYSRNWTETSVEMMGIIHRANNGKLNMNNDLDRLFDEFLRNGGETGYSNLESVDDFMGKTEKKLKAMQRVGVIRGAGTVLSYLGDSLDNFNRWAELISRFACYRTSRHAGRSISRSVDDAKDITVNFNTKGAGTVAAVKNEKGNRMAFWAAQLSQIGRGAYVFWNAGVQGMTNFGRAIGNNKKKAAAMTAFWMGLGYTIALLMSGFGGDDDNDKKKTGYYNLPKYIRRNNLCFKVGNKWITIPLSIEIRALYGMGELAYSYMSGNEYYNNGEVTREIMSQVSQIMPIDMMEDGGGINALVPSSVKPFWELYNNIDWTGMPIYKDTPYNKNEPKWQKAYSSTNQNLVDFSKWINETTGGSEHSSGWADVNPAALEHLVEGYLGGIGTMASQTLKSVDMARGKQEFDWRNVPIASRFIKSGDSRAEAKNYRSAFFEYKEDIQKIVDEVNGYNRDMHSQELSDSERDSAYRKKLELMQSPEYLFYRDTWKPGQNMIQKARENGDSEFEESMTRELVDAYRQFRMQQKNK